jgi:hypothetical protein
VSVLDRLVAAVVDPFRRCLARIFLACDRSRPVARRGMPYLKAKTMARIAARNLARRERREIKRFERRVRTGRAA